MTLVEVNASFSPGGHLTQVDRHKLIASSCIFVKFTTFCVNLQPTCESVWSPIASPYASSGFANVDLRVRLASGLTRIQPLPPPETSAHAQRHQLSYLGAECSTISKIAYIGRE